MALCIIFFSFLAFRLTSRISTVVQCAVILLYIPIEGAAFQFFHLFSPYFFYLLGYHAEWTSSLLDLE